MGVKGLTPRAHIAFCEIKSSVANLYLKSGTYILFKVIKKTNG